MPTTTLEWLVLLAAGITLGLLAAHFFDVLY